jgi:diguanylate cyclase (GGDEF)-like protein
MSPMAPVRLVLVVGLVRLAIGAGLLATWRRVPPAAIQGLALLVVVSSAVLIANSHTLGGVVVSALGMPWLGVWAAAFLPPRRAIQHAAVITAALAAGVAATDAPRAIAAGVAIGLTTWAATLTFVAIAAHVRAHLETDPLTGLLNRAGLRRAAAREGAAAARSGAPVAIAVLDLDGFKAINDTFGHAAGDRALAELGRAWAEGFRGEGLLGRQGGDEFVLVMCGARRAEMLTLLARLRAACAVRWTAGVSELCAGECLDACVDRADADLYRQKRNLARRAA